MVPVQAAQTYSMPLVFVLIADKDALQSSAFHGLTIPHNQVSSLARSSGHCTTEVRRPALHVSRHALTVGLQTSRQSAHTPSGTLGKYGAQCPLLMEGQITCPASLLRADCPKNPKPCDLLQRGDRDSSMCVWGLGSDADMVIVEDVLLDLRFLRHESSRWPKPIRFLACAPLTASNGYRIGYL